MTPPPRPRIVDASLDQAFRDEAVRQGRSPDDFWVREYLDYEWDRGRHLVEAFVEDLPGKSALEFGCIIGATAIVLSLLGCRVTAVDVDARVIAIAKKNAARYGQTQITFTQIAAGGQLPHPQSSFDLVTCNSVLEYVDPRDLPNALSEIDRVLRPCGVVLVLATSNRLAPREVHSRRWLSNYLPAAVDSWLEPRQRGIFPWEVTRRFHGYVDLVKADRGERYFAAREKMGDSGAKLTSLKLLSLAGRTLGLPASAMTPSFFLALRKP